MPTRIYDIGDKVILHAETRVNNVLVSCDGEFNVKIPGEPQRVTVSANMNPDGVFEGTYTVTKSGRHYYRFIASGAQVGEEEHWFDVREKA